MTPAVRRSLLIALVIAGVLFWEMMRPVPQPAGILAPDPPRVTAPAAQPPSLQRDDYSFNALASFDAKARILSTKRYAGAREARIAPLDLALGWGQLSDTTRLKSVDVAQTERRVLFQSYDPEYPDAEMETNLMNVHVIAADAEIEKRLKDLRAGNIVRLEGWLVEAVGRDGWRWKGQPRERAPAAPATLLWVHSIEIEA